MKVRKLLALVLAFAMIMSTMSFAVLAEDTAEVSLWDGTSYSLDWLSDGNPEATAGDAFYLNSAEDLAGFAYYVNNYASTNNIFTGDTVYLNVNVDLDNHPWAPIGTAVPREKNRFYGSFDGQGHTISNLNVEKGHYYAGLFGQIPTYNYSQSFSNITLNNVISVAEDETESGKSKEAAGALIGRANGSVISDCSVTGEINISGDRFVGGLVGHSYARISECIVTGTGTINANTWQVGGIAGSHGATASYTSSVKDCVVAGIGEDGLAISSYYASVGGAFGAVSVSGVESTTMDNIFVTNVALSAVSTSSGTGIATVASGYTATNSTSANVSATLDGEKYDDFTDASETVAVAEVNGVYYTDFVEALKAIKENSVFNLLSDVTINDKWDCRYTGSKITVPFTFNGNGHTLKFTNEINDGFNHLTVFRFEADAIVKDLTVDLSEAVSVFGGRLRVISSKANLTVDGCTFIGNDEYTNTRAVIFGEGAGENTANLSIAVTNSSFKNWTKGLGDNENAQDVKNIIVSGNVFTNADVAVSASESVSFTGNTMENGYVSIVTYAPTTSLTVEATGNVLEKEEGGRKNTILAGTITGQEGFGVPAAEVNGKKYMTVTEAVNKAVENDVVFVAPGAYDLTGINIKKSIVITGDPDYGKAVLNGATSIVKPVITIKDVTNGGIKYNAPNVVFDNLVFDVAKDAAGNGWNVSAIGYYYEDIADREGLTVTNCDFINNSSIGMSAIAANIANYTVSNNTFANFATMVHSYVDHGKLGNVVISGNTYTNVDNIASVYWGAENTEAESTLTITDNKSTDDNVAKIAVDNFGYTKDQPVVSIEKATITGNDAELTFVNHSDDIVFVTDEEFVPQYKNEAAAAAAAASGVTGYVYINYGTANEKVLYLNNRVIAAVAKTINVAFDDKTAAGTEGEKIYNIELTVSDAEIINRLNSVDLTFDLNVTEGKIAYEIIPSNKEIEINPVYNPADGSIIEGRYEFHYAGKDNVKTDTDTTIIIGQVKFTGYGAFEFGVTKADTNAAHATTLQDNIVETYIPNGNIANGEGVLNIDNATIGNTGVIAIPRRALTVKVSFPNGICENDAAYQDMTLSIVGDGVEVNEKLGYGLRKDSNGVVYYEFKCGDTILNTPYTVTLEGAGYRTVKYTVNMTEAKTLNFWNNVKDNEVYVEVSASGVKKYAQNVTFLAGDIVKDNNINVYDLSAVVSYFGEIDLDKDNKPGYAKYDLNRDGKVDSKDVAYVLVSWGN